MISYLCRKICLKKDGFTMVELLMSIGLLVILSVISIEMISSQVDSARFDETVAILTKIREGMTGNPDVKVSGSRSSFGYVGDIGAFGHIADLVTNPSLPAYAVSATSRFGLGWNGPYVEGTGPSTSFVNDAWGTPFVYLAPYSGYMGYGAYDGVSMNAFLRPVN